MSPKASAYSLFLISVTLFAAGGASAMEGAVPTNMVSSRSVTLADCYREAIRQSETLAIDQESINRLRYQYQEGVGAVLPSISWVKTQFYQETDVASSTGGVQGTLADPSRKESRFELYQPLFSGFRDFNLLSGLKIARNQANHRVQRAAHTLLLDVANVFYTSLSLQESLDVLLAQRDLSRERLKELQRRVQLGKSRDSEVLSDRVNLASLEAEIEETKRQWYMARLTLEFLSTIPPDVVLVDDRPTPDIPSFEDARQRAMKRPDLLAAEEQRQMADYQRKYEQAGYYPTLGLDAKYYTEREGFQKDIKWDALFTLDVPLFQGFRTKARVKQARSDMLLSELELRRLQRQVRQEVDSSVRDLQYAISQSKFFAEAVDLGERNYKVQQQEYRLGLINNLEVLQVLNTLQSLRVKKLQSDAAVKLNEIRMRVAMGESL